MLRILSGWRGRICGAAGALCVLGMLAWGQAAAAPVVEDVRVGDHGTKTRFVLDISEGVDFRAYVLADPYRVVLDLPEVGWRLPARPLPSGIGLFQRLRYGLFKPGTSRVVVDLKGPATVGGAFLLEPRGGHDYRLVVDMVPATRDAVLASGSPPAAAPSPEASSSTPRTDFAAPAPAGSDAAATRAALPFAPPPVKPAARRDKWIVALDPGHGGVDPGGIGASGTYEKHITLAMARELAAALENTGRYKVVMTRDRDIFIRLRDRIAFARHAGADLFLSIHADTIPQKNVRGLSVYTLSEKASDSEAGLLAEQENKADLIAGVDLTHETPEVTNILIDLAQRETMNESARFASDLVKQLAREARLLNNTHRFAGFAVLKAPDVPSVLVELGFLSNPTDEAALKQSAYRNKLTTAIVRGVDDYFVGIEQAGLPR